MPKNLALGYPLWSDLGMTKPTEPPGAGRPLNDPGIKLWCGKALTARRMIAGLSTRDVAEACGVAASTVCRWEDGTNAPVNEHVLLLANLFKCRIATFTREPMDAASQAMLTLAQRRRA